MIISNLKIKNFRSYEDETEFQFSPIGDKNIVLIGGENGAGKSTIFEAIKLCIYGPIAYGYQGHNSTYNAKIKANINHNAYKENKMDAFISIMILLPEGTSQNAYEISRRWDFEDKKLVEHYTVVKNSEPLCGESINYFENYLTSLIPPNLFDFFFFDGEDLSDSFIGKSSSLHLKESILQLCGFDTLDLLKNQLIQYQRSVAISSTNLKTFESEFDLATAECKNITTALSNLEEDLKKENIKFESLSLDLNWHEEKFRNAGGLLEKEKNKLIENLNNLEHERNDINQYIKDFANDILPLLINTTRLEKIKTQILAEDTLNNYTNFKNKLSVSVIESSLIEAEIIRNSSTVNLTKVLNLILEKLFDIKTITHITSIHLLSNDDKNTVLQAIDNILTNKTSYSNIISKKYERIATINDEIKNIKQKINSSVNDSVLNEYLNKSKELNEQLSKSKSVIANLDYRIEEFKKDLVVSENKLKKAKNRLVEAMQSNKTLDLSNNLVETLDEIIFELSQEKIHEIEENFMSIFKELIRKDNYIDSIEVQSNFDTTLYTNMEYSSIDIINSINHIGIDDVEKKYGNKFIEDLMKVYPSKNKKELVENIKIKPIDLLMLRTKFDINTFSKGEKQIYILSLVWALIKSSGVQISFVIDTPYGRIDETHREYLTTKYLPNISNQVIILSTNEEIDKNLYATMKPFICDEYLLHYLDNERKTKVQQGYFFEV